MDHFNENFSINPNLFVNIKRISLNDNFEKYKLLAIENSAYFKFGCKILKNPLILPKLYAALKYLTGEGDESYDGYKGSYSFTFVLEVLKNSRSSKYLYSIYHYRSYIEFYLREIVSKESPKRTEIMHQPNDEFFSDDDICFFSQYFCSYSLGYIEGAQHVPKPFIKSSDSNCILFGYYNGEYFCRQYDSSNVYHKEKSQLEVNLSV